MLRSLLSLSLLLISVTTLPAQQKDIVDTAVAAGSFKTLVAAVKAADLVDTLKGKGPFTVFAPTDEAFAKLPKAAIADLLKPENKAQLQSILTYHVVPGKVLAGDLLQVSAAKTVQGSPAQFGLTVQGANIIKTDIQCANGVIHVIDSVIMPPKQAAKTSHMPAKMNMPVAMQHPRTIIQTAIASGSQLYNTGNACQCASLYTQTMKKLANHASVSADKRKNIQSKLAAANSIQDSDSRAWALRRGLDSVYHQL